MNKGFAGIQIHNYYNALDGQEILYAMISKITKCGRIMRHECVQTNIHNYNTTSMRQAERENTKSLYKNPQYLDAILSVIFLKRELMISQKPTDAHSWKRKLKL